MSSVAEIFGKNAVYREKLRSDEWKNFARDRRQTAGGACEACKRSGLALHVHHLFYDPNREPWEYSSAETVVLCWACHKSMHEQLIEFRKTVFRFLNAQSFPVLNIALATALSGGIDPVRFGYAMLEFANSPRSIELFFKAWFERKPVPDSR